MTQLNVWHDKVGLWINSTHEGNNGDTRLYYLSLCQECNADDVTGVATHPMLIRCNIYTYIYVIYKAIYSLDTYKYKCVI